MKYATKKQFQVIINKAINLALEQGSKCCDNIGYCSYLEKDGRKCIVGQLLDPNVCSPGLLLGNVNQIATHVEESLGFKLRGDYICVLGKMQVCHDTANELVTRNYAHELLVSLTAKFKEKEIVAMGLNLDGIDYELTQPTYKEN